MKAPKIAKRVRRAVDSGSERKHLTGARGRTADSAPRKGSRNEARDRCLLLLIFRHGLRVSEACRLKLDQVDIDSRVLRRRAVSALTKLKIGRAMPASHGIFHSVCCENVLRG
jgi:integrase